MKFIILIICVTIVTIELLYLLFKKCELIIKNQHEIKLKEVEFSHKKQWEEIIKKHNEDKDKETIEKSISEIKSGLDKKQDKDKPSSLDMDKFYMATLLMKDKDVKNISKEIDTVKEIYETLKRDVL